MSGLERSFRSGISSGYTEGLEKGPTQSTGKPPKGRYPANVILEEEAGRLLDLQSGERKGGSEVTFSKARKASQSIGAWRGAITQSYADTGGASRFFYCSKVSPSERGPDNHHPTIKPIALMEYLCKLTKTPTGGIVCDPYSGSGSTGVACVKTDRQFLGFEISQKYTDTANLRIQATEKGLTLPELRAGQGSLF